MKIFSQIRSSVFNIKKISNLILSFIYPGKEYFTKEILNKYINRQYLGESIKIPLLKINKEKNNKNLRYEFASRLFIYPPNGWSIYLSNGNIVGNPPYFSKKNSLANYLSDYF